MQLDTLHAYLVSKGNVSDGSDPNLPVMKLYHADSAELSGESVYALFLPHMFSVDDELPSYHKGHLQIITSSEDYDAGFELAQTLALDLTVYGLDLTDMHIYRCVPKTLPIGYRKNEENRFEFSVNFDVVLRLI